MRDRGSLGHQLFDLAQQAQNSGALTRTPNVKLNVTVSL
jgi:hypothetical protein